MNMINNSLEEKDNVPVANLEIFDSIKQLEFADFVLDHEDFTLSLYKQYILQIKEMSESDQNSFLKVLKVAEIIDNHSLEKEDSFLAAIYLEATAENSIDYLLKQNNLSRESFINGHKLLLKGTNSQRYADKDYRTDNIACVGKRLPDGGRYVSYYALPYTDIDEAIENLLNFYHSDCYDEHMFLKSLIIHAIVASLQMFDDGNTRYARILQNLKLYELTKQNLDPFLNNPVLYGTRSYYPYRGKYRELISELVLSPNNESWANWFEFNLNRVEDQMYLIDGKISQYKKLIK